MYTVTHYTGAPEPTTYTTAAAPTIDSAGAVRFDVNGAQVVLLGSVKIEKVAQA